MRFPSIRFVIFVCSLLASQLGTAQVSKQGKKLYPQFQTIYTESAEHTDLVDSALAVGMRIFKAEQDQSAEKLDTVFMAVLCQDMAVLCERNFDYDASTPYFLLAASYFQKANKSLEAGLAMSRYLLAYEVVRLTRLKKDAWKSGDSLIFDHGNGDSTIWFTTNAREMHYSKKRDTIFVTLNSGRAQNIIEDSKFDIFTTFDTFEAIKRPIVQAGTGFITQINDFTCEGFVVLEEDFSDTIYDNDAFEVKIKVDKRFAQSYLSKLGGYNIKVTNHLSDVYYVGGDGNLTINSHRFERPLYLAMIQGMRDAISYYDSMDTNILDNTIDEGRFGGMTYRECMQVANEYDVERFMDYVSSYPAKYINREFSFLTIFITWAINGTYCGNDEQVVLDTILKLPKEILLSEKQVWGNYYRVLTDPDSVFLKMVSNQYELNPTKRIEILDKMQALAIAMGNAQSDSFYSVNLLYEYYGVKKYNKALDYADHVWPRLQGMQKRLIALYKGVLFSSLNNSMEAIRFLDSSLEIDSGYFYAKGYKGWNLIKLGRLKEAFPHCEYAWQYDSMVPWTNINLGHANLLRGNKAEARRLYKKSFEYMTVESDFYEGLLTDFDYFIKAGLNEVEFKELKTEFTAYYVANFKYLIIGDSLKSRGVTFEEKEEYDESIRLMGEANRAFYMDPKPNWEKIHGIYRWLGYLYYKKKEYVSSVAYYKKAGAVTVTQELGEDNLISDYTDIANIYDWMDDTLHEMEYRSRASSMEVALREKRDPKRFYFISIGSANTNRNDSFAVADANALSEAILNSADLQFDSVTNMTFTGKSANSNNLKNALDTAIYTLGDNDVFMFYYSGYGNTGENEGIHLSDGVFSIRDLSGYLSQVPAGRQMHIMDCNGLNWREWYQRGTFSLLSSEKRSLVFLGLKNARIEEHTLGHSVLTNALISGLKESLLDGTASATEWLSNAANEMLDNGHLYALEMQTFGHDFTVGKAKIELNADDTFPPVIELFGAIATRGESISLVPSKSVTAGRITDNSRIVHAQANGITLVVASNGRFELPKEVIGARNIVISAVDEFGNKAVREFIVSQTEAAKTAESSKYAYLFASKDYDFWTDLKNPVFDAEKIGELLESYYGYKVTIIRNPNRYEVTEKLDQIRRFKFKPNDQLLVFFAGHGLYDSVWGGYYVCPESKLPKDDKYYETYYPQQKIADLVDGCAARNVFLVMDVCFGGKMFDKIDKHEYRTVNDGNEMSADEYIGKMLEIPCRQFLTSGGNNYVEDGVAGAHSPFASRFIFALEEAAMKKDYISASEVMDYLRTMKTVGNDRKSSPRYGFFGGDKDAEYVLKVTRKMRNSAVIAGI